jgi:hypothetical protein
MKTTTQYRIPIDMGVEKRNQRRCSSKLKFFLTEQAWTCFYLPTTVAQIQFAATPRKAFDYRIFPSGGTGCGIRRASPDRSMHTTQICVLTPLSYNPSVRLASFLSFSLSCSLVHDIDSMLEVIIHIQREPFDSRLLYFH